MYINKKKYKNHYDCPCDNNLGVVYIRCNTTKGKMSLMSKLHRKYDKVEYCVDERIFKCSGLKRIGQTNKFDYRPYYVETV